MKRFSKTEARQIVENITMSNMDKCFTATYETIIRTLRSTFGDKRTLKSFISFDMGCIIVGLYADQLISVRESGQSDEVAKDQYLSVRRFIHTEVLGW